MAIFDTTTEPKEDLLDASNYFYWIQLDLEGNILASNRKFQDQESIFKKVEMKKNITDFFISNDLSNYQMQLEKALYFEERNFLMGLRKLTPDKTDFFWTRWEFTILYEEGRAKRISGIGHTMEKTSENLLDFTSNNEEVEVSEAFLDGLFEESLIGFWIWDVNNSKEKINISLVSLLGMDANHLHLGKTEVYWKKQIHPDDIEMVTVLLEKHLLSKGKIPFHGQFRIKSKDNLEKWVIGYGKVIQWSDDDKPILMVGGFFDVSEKKKSEDLIKQQSDFLKKLSFDQSHTMRSKLANILGILEVIDPKAIPSDQSTFIKLLKSEARKLDIALKQSIVNSSRLNFNVSADKEELSSPE
ncbi:PAS domain-containing protein [Fontibacter flavus]|uniref:histidine kinase n=1 Tax=Fontibacter flavus TaxID=654838 RepID=A0ABV6FY80_9BACT